MKIVIYQYTFNINGKSYIWQTKNFDKRHKEHMYVSRNNPKYCFERALAKHGVENFNIEIIEYVNERNADKREAFWIKKFDTLAPDGYNIKPGGLTTRGFV